MFSIYFILGRLPFIFLYLVALSQMEHAISKAIKRLLLMKNKTIIGIAFVASGRSLDCSFFMVTCLQIIDGVQKSFGRQKFPMNLRNWNTDKQSNKVREVIFLYAICNTIFRNIIPYPIVVKDLANRDELAVSEFELEERITLNLQLIEGHANGALFCERFRHELHISRC